MARVSIAAVCLAALCTAAFALPAPPPTYFTPAPPGSNMTVSVAQCHNKTCTGACNVEEYAEARCYAKGRNSLRFRCRGAEVLLTKYAETQRCDGDRDWSVSYLVRRCITDPAGGWMTLLCRP
jgi:hypothetical protein